MVAGLVGRSLLKGFLSGAIGLVVTVLGNDPVMGQPRLTLGIEFLEGGIPFLPVLIPWRHDAHWRTSGFDQHRT